MRRTTSGRVRSATTGAWAMWTCPNCRGHADAIVEVCPHCGALAIAVEAADPTPVATDQAPDPESPTEYEFQRFPDAGLGAVECYIGVESAEAEAVARFLIVQGVEAKTDVVRPSATEAPIHRVRVPISDLGRAMALIDTQQKRRQAKR